MWIARATLITMIVKRERDASTLVEDPGAEREMDAQVKEAEVSRPKTSETTHLSAENKTRIPLRLEQVGSSEWMLKDTFA
jgi:hypothetical protein